MTKQEEYLYQEILDRTQEIIELKDEVLNLQEELRFETHCKNTYKAGFDHCIKLGKAKVVDIAIEGIRVEEEI